MNDCLACGLRPIADTYGAHERVEDADGECGSARERLRHVQLGVRIVVVVLVQKLHVRVVTCQSRHAHLQSRDLARAANHVRVVTCQSQHAHLVQSYRF